MKFLNCNNKAEFRTTNHLSNVRTRTCHLHIRQNVQLRGKIAFVFRQNKRERARNEKYKRNGETIIRSGMEKSKVNADERVSGVQNEMKEQEGEKFAKKSRRL